MKRTLRLGIELLVVIAVVAGLTISLIAMVGEREGASVWLSGEEVREAQQRAERIANALTQYKSENGEYPVLLSDLVPIYLDEVPEFPIENIVWDYNRAQKGDTCSLGFHSGIVEYWLNPQEIDDRGWIIIG